MSHVPLAGGATSTAAPPLHSVVRQGRQSSEGEAKGRELLINNPVENEALGYLVDGIVMALVACL